MYTHTYAYDEQGYVISEDLIGNNGYFSIYKLFSRWFHYEYRTPWIYSHFYYGSAEMDKEDLKDNIILSSNDRIKGKLHIEKVKAIVIHDHPFLGILKQEYDDGEILPLTIKKHFVEITVQWIDFPSKPEREVFWVIHVKAEKIYWENIPDLPWD